MPETRVVLYRDVDGSCPFLEWFDELPAKLQDKCYLRLERLGVRRLDMAKRTKPAIDAVEILHRRFYRGKTARLKNLEAARANEEVGRRIHELRTAAGLTQTQLARLIGTTASVICRLEDADYEGHSLVMLRRIAGALNQRIEIRFVPIRRSA